MTDAPMLVAVGLVLGATLGLLVAILLGAEIAATVAVGAGLGLVFGGIGVMIKTDVESRAHA